MSEPAVVDRPATYDDVLNAPAHSIAQLIDGALHTQPRPASRHAMAASSLSVELGGPFSKGRGGPGGWWIVYEPELHLGRDVLVPDLAGWSKDRMPDFPDAAFFDLAPDWVCEVLSPSTERLDRFVKRPIYAHHAVRYLWLVDPRSRGLEAFELRDGEWVLIASLSEADPVKVAPFDAIEFPLSSLWPD